MTPQEKDLLTQLADRLRKGSVEQKDPEAEALIHATIAAQPDAPYMLAQTVLIQDFALSQAQAQIAELQKQLAAAKAAPPASGGFLSGLFGRGNSADAQAGNGGAAPWNRGNSAVRPAPGNPGFGQPGYGGQPQQQPGFVPPGGSPWAGQQPQQGGGMFGGGGMMGGSQPSFLRSAATTALGIAGGAMLFQGVQSMFGGHSGGGLLGGMQQQPSLSEQSGYGADGSHPTDGFTDVGSGYDQGGYGQGGYDQGAYNPPDPGYAPQNDIQDAGWDNSSGGDAGGDWGGGGGGSDDSWV